MDLCDLMPQKLNTSSLQFWLMPSIVLCANGRTYPPAQQSPTGIVGLLRQPGRRPYNRSGPLQLAAGIGRR